MTPLVGVRIALVVFVVSILQVSAFSGFTIGGGGPDVLLVVLVSIGLLRGSVTGAISGFAAGLIVDIATLGTLGVTSLLLTLAGYWAGRYGETTARGRVQAPLIATVVATLLFELGSYGLHLLLGESISAGPLLVAVPATLVCNALLAYPVYALIRRLVGTMDRTGRAREVELFV